MLYFSFKFIVKLNNRPSIDSYIISTHHRLQSHPISPMAPIYKRQLIASSCYWQVAPKHTIIQHQDSDCFWVSSCHFFRTSFRSGSTSYSILRFYTTRFRNWLSFPASSLLIGTLLDKPSSGSIYPLKMYSNYNPHSSPMFYKGSIDEHIHSSVQPEAEVDQSEKGRGTSQQAPTTGVSIQTHEGWQEIHPWGCYRTSHPQCAWV